MATLVANQPRWKVVVVVLALVVAVLGAGWLWQHNRTPAANPVAGNQAGANELVPLTVVTLTPEQQATAGLRCQAVTRGTLQLTRRVPGRVTQNANKMVEIRAPVAGMVKEVAVNPGDVVNAGQRLVVLSSPEVGLARETVLSDEAQLRLSEQAYDWSRQTGVNVQELITMFATRPPIEQVEKLFADKPLGAHREQIVASYSRLALAETGVKQLDLGEKTGSVSQRLAQQRHSDREVATAAFYAACEQARFAARQQQDRDRAAVEHAARLLAISRERLNALVGPYGDPSALSNSKSIEYSSLTVLAPWAATVDVRHVVPSSNVTAAQPLVTLVDLNTVWVSAQLYEQDYAAIDLNQLKQLDVQVPAVSDETVKGEVRFTSVGLSPQTQSVSIVAELSNQSRRYRPGMFAWIEIPAETIDDVLTVPTSAIVNQDHQTYVFVVDGENRYRRVDVELGTRSPDRVEIRRGLNEGEQVVTAGVFTLKSEMLLAAEGDEE